MNSKLTRLKKRATEPSFKSKQKTKRLWVAKVEKGILFGSSSDKVFPVRFSI